MVLLQGKRAIVTGGTRGLGFAIAKRFVENGASVTIFGTNEERAKLAVTSLLECKVENAQDISYECVDVSNTQQVKSEIGKYLEKENKIDILVNCAGITRDKLFMKMQESDWDQVIDTNLKSVYNLTSAVIRTMMKARTGKIINISSVIGLTGNPGQVNYAASKLGMVGFTRSLAKEVGSRGICVNCIAPGFFKSDMTDALSDTQKEAILQKVPMGRLGDPKEIGDAALFLASEMANYITGQVLTVDGGMIS